MCIYNCHSLQQEKFQSHITSQLKQFGDQNTLVPDFLFYDVGEKDHGKPFLNLAVDIGYQGALINNIFTFLASSKY
jgi:hypothetical protein